MFSFPPWMLNNSWFTSDYDNEDAVGTFPVFGVPSPAWVDYGSLEYGSSSGPVVELISDVIMASCVFISTLVAILIQSVASFNFASLEID